MNLVRELKYLGCTPIMIMQIQQLIRPLRAQAWEQGHLTRWHLGPDDCECYAKSRSECGCGLYGTGELLSLEDNPYLPKPTGGTP